jgi:hypothetical protein
VFEGKGSQKAPLSFKTSKIPKALKDFIGFKTLESKVKEFLREGSDERREQH